MTLLNINDVAKDDSSSMAAGRFGEVFIFVQNITSRQLKVIWIIWKGFDNYKNELQYFEL